MDTSFTGPHGQAPADHFLHIMEASKPTHEDLQLAGQYLRGNIRDRTFADESYLGGNFIFYSPDYAKAKGQQNVDLYSRRSGKHMLDALTVNVPPDLSAIEVGIYGDEDMASRAKLHNEGGEFRTRQGTGKHSYKNAKKKWGTDIRIQKKGGRGTGTMPARPWLGANDEDIAAMQKIIVDEIAKRWEMS